MSHSLLEQLVHSTARKMLADFEASAQAQHRGSKGTIREDKFREYLSRHLPRTVDVVGSSEIVATNGEHSGQCDVLITDPAAQFLYDEDSYRISTVESVLGVIEIKSNLTAHELREAVRKLAKIKAMPRSAYLPQTEPIRWRKMYGRRWETLPIIGMVLAYDGAELDTLGDAFAEVAGEFTDEPHLRTDSVWVLNRGALIWVDNADGINAAPNPDDSIGALKAAPGEVLVHLMAHLHELFAAVWTPGVRINDYLGSASFGQRHRKWQHTEVSRTGQG